MDDLFMEKQTELLIYVAAEDGVEVYFDELAYNTKGEIQKQTNRSVKYGIESGNFKSMSSVN